MYEMRMGMKRGGDVRVAFEVDWVGVCDGEETGVDVEGGVFFDGDGLALGTRMRNALGFEVWLTFWLCGTRGGVRRPCR